MRTLRSKTFAECGARDSLVERIQSKWMAMRMSESNGVTYVIQCGFQCGFQCGLDPAGDGTDTHKLELRSAKTALDDES